MHICDRVHRDTRWIGGLSHQSSDLSHLCSQLQKVVICASSDTRLKWIYIESYLANQQTTKVMLTKGVPNKSGNMQVSKQSTLFYWNILHLHKGHWCNQSRGTVTSYQLTEMFSSWNPDDSPKACVCFSYIPPSPIAWAIVVTSLDDVMIICSTFQ